MALQVSNSGSANNELPRATGVMTVVVGAPRTHGVGASASLESRESAAPAQVGPETRAPVAGHA